MISTYNLAELYTAMGDTDKATQLQEEVVKNIEERNKRSGRGEGSSSEGGEGSSGISSGVSTGNVSASTQAKILEYTHASKSASTTTATATTATTATTTATVDPPAPMNAVADKFDAAKIVAKEQQTYLATTPDSEEERKRKLLAQTMATRPHKPATRRGAKKVV